MAVKALAWLLVPVLGVSELVGHLFFSTRAPNLTEWRATRDTVAALRRHGELVVVAPAWAEPNARAAYGDALMPLTNVARADETTFPTAIEVSILGASAPELHGWKVAHEERTGKIRLRVLENPHPVTVAYDFVDKIAEATVADVRGATRQPCVWNATAPRSAGGLHGDPAFPSMRHECPGSESHFVGITVVEDQNWRGRRCIWAEPTGGVLTISFASVPVGTVVRGYATLPWWVERELRGAPVEMQVVVGGEEIGTYVHNDGEGWKAFEMPTGKHRGTTSTVEFRVHSRHPSEREFCFQADTR
jgi:hypothetical protein